MTVPPATTSVRVLLPFHLRRLAHSDPEVVVAVREPVTLGAVLDALEAAHPALGGTTRDRATGRRRAFVRFFVGEDDWSNEPSDRPLPPAVAAGDVAVRVVGAMAGG